MQSPTCDLFGTYEQEDNILTSFSVGSLIFNDLTFPPVILHSVVDHNKQTGREGKVDYYGNQHS